ncbi:MAG: single-stranded-DNA-specific exonuclease RecJ [Bacteroidota bacterium]
MTEKKWLLLPEPDKQKTNELAMALGGKNHETLAGLLVQRGIESTEEAKSFFNPSLEHLHDPFLMADMEKAIDRLELAMERGEKIMIFGDYDVDGTTAVSLVFSFFRPLYQHIEFYIPDRYAEGYGISYLSIDYAAENNIRLIIALDCGIKSVAHIEKANSLGIDYIICDHHLPGETLPPAVAVLDAKRADCGYPFKELSGCGVGFKLMQALCIRRGLDKSLLLPCLDLLVISIAADIVPVTGENRIFCFHGLIQVNNNPRPGVEALIEVAGFRKEFNEKEGRETWCLNITNVVFGLAPRINAAGRIAHAKAAVELLLSETQETAREMAFGVNVNNNERRTVDSSITEEALEMIATDAFLKTASSTVLFNENWHKGVVGIVASRCIEHYYRPTIILTGSGENAGGSARSVAGFDLYEALGECSDLLLQYGGHTHAAGMTLKKENVPAFIKRFEEVVKARITHEQTIPIISLDLRLDFERITDAFCRNIGRMAPFGPLNMQPVFLSERVQDNGQVTLLKAKTPGSPDHIKMCLQQHSGGPVIEAIAFGMGEYYKQVATGNFFDVCYTIDYQLWNGRYIKKLMVKDLKF